MVFSSIVFLIFFLPALLALYFLVPKRFRWLRNLILLLFSLVFYGWIKPKFLLLLLTSTAINYLCGLLAAPDRRPEVRKFGVSAAVVLGLGLLGWFKYSGFLGEMLVDMGAAISVPKVVLPIGISFFTFQGLSYVVDVYRGQAAMQKNPLNVALYVALFPQLVAGPIVRYTTVAEEITSRDENLDNFSAGTVRFLLGLGKKMLLANPMAEIADSVFAIAPGTLSVSLAWVGILAYTFQIYFDFSAYSDMAIGLGKLFGFHFLENFNYPYVAKSITDFWRRWHISLSTWFRDYLYIPLGGSRCSRAKQIRNIAAVWLLTGLWHGAAWTFVLWGVWFLLLLMGERYLWGNALNKAPAFAGHIYTMLAVMISWVLFRSTSVSYAFSYIGAMFSFGGTLFDGQTVYYLRQYAPELVCCIIGIFPAKQMLQQHLTRRKQNTAVQLVLIWVPKFAALAMLALSYTRLVAGSFNPFIYFQF